GHTHKGHPGEGQKEKNPGQGIARSRQKRERFCRLFYFEHHAQNIALPNALTPRPNGNAGRPPENDDSGRDRHALPVLLLPVGWQAVSLGEPLDCPYVPYPWATQQPGPDYRTPWLHGATGEKSLPVRPELPR